MPLHLGGEGVAEGALFPLLFVALPSLFYFCPVVLPFPARPFVLRDSCVLNPAVGVVRLHGVCAKGSALLF